MLGLIWNMSIQEFVLIAVVAVLVFGKRLPQVAGQAFRQVARLRRQLDDFRRESGIDREFRDVQDSLRDVTRQATLDPTFQDRTEPAHVEPEAPPEEGDETTGTVS